MGVTEQDLDLEAIAEALRSSFSSIADIDRLLFLRLGLNLAEIAGSGNLLVVINELLKYTRRTNQTLSLLKAALRDNPQNPLLRTISERYLTTVREPEQPTKPEMSSEHPPKRPARLLFCYAPSDIAHADALRRHLVSLQRQGLLAESWSEADIPLGAESEREINQRWQAADLILLLVSASLLADTPHYLSFAEENRNHALIVPVVVSDVLWQFGWLGGLQAYPRGADGQVLPVAHWCRSDDAWSSVLHALSDALQRKRQA